MKRIEETFEELNNEATKQSMRETKFRERKNPQELQRISDRHGATDVVTNTYTPEEIRLEHIRITQGPSSYNEEYKKSLENEDISRNEYTRRNKVINQKIEEISRGLDQEQKEELVKAAYPDNELDLILDDVQRGGQGSQDFIDTALIEGAILSAYRQTTTQKEKSMKEAYTTQDLIKNPQGLNVEGTKKVAEDKKLVAQVKNQFSDEEIHYLYHLWNKDTQKMSEVKDLLVPSEYEDESELQSQLRQKTDRFEDYIVNTLRGDRDELKRMLEQMMSGDLLDYFSKSVEEDFSRVDAIFKIKHLLHKMSFEVAYEQTNIETQSEKDTSKMTFSERLNRLHKETQGQTYNEANGTYMCVWFPPTYQPNCEMNKDFSFFSDENGYTEEDRNKIERLSLGEYAEMGRGGHIVIKID